MPDKRRSRDFRPSLNETLESRVVLSGFKFPATVMGPVKTLGYQGPKVLTSHTYEDLQHTIDRTLKAFQRDFEKAFIQAKGFGTALDKALGTTPGGKVGFGPGQYKTGLLAKIDRIMAKVESRLPYGRGLSGTTGGAGLSTNTIGTSGSNSTGYSVAELLDAALNSGSGATSYKSARAAIEIVRQSTLNIVGKGVAAGVPVPGILPSYIITFGPAGSGNFGLRNN